MTEVDRSPQSRHTCLSTRPPAWTLTDASVGLASGVGFFAHQRNERLQSQTCMPILTTYTTNGPSLVMEPPPKRGRMAILHPRSHNVQLEKARDRNDLKLKSRFEAIFDKYSFDFSHVGDEIDVFTGQVVVDNGHIASMTNETDAGDLRPTQQTTGKRFLRAITEAPDFGRLTANDADRVKNREEHGTTFVMDANDSDQSDDQEDEVSLHEESMSDMARSLSDSDDSLFPDDHNRASSPDDLFEKSSCLEVHPDGEHLSFDSGIEVDRWSRERNSQDTTNRGRKSVTTPHFPHDHFKTTWQEPFDTPHSERPIPSASFRQTPPPAPPSVARKQDSPNASWSLWNDQQPQQPRIKRKRRAVIQQTRSRSVLRDESVDPLQADLPKAYKRGRGDGRPSITQSATAGGSKSRQVRNDDRSSTKRISRRPNNYREPTTDAESDNEIDSALSSNERAEETGEGLCSYCGRAFSSKESLHAHWKRILRKANRLGDDNSHDLDTIQALTGEVALFRRVIGQDTDSKPPASAIYGKSPMTAALTQSEESSELASADEDNNGPEVKLGPACLDCQRRKDRCDHRQPAEPDEGRYGPACAECRQNRIRCAHRRYLGPKRRRGKRQASPANDDDDESVQT